MYCLSLNPSHLDIIKKIGYKAVGLGDSDFSEDWLRDNKGTNITKKK